MNRAYIHRPDSHPFVEAIVEGLTAEGVSLTNSPEDAYFVVMGGLHDEWMVRECRREEKPILLGDLGYLKRSNSRNKDGYYQLGWNRIGWIPEGPLTEDRLDRLGLDIEDDLPPRGERWVIVSQVPGDRQHGYNLDQLGEIYSSYARIIRNHRPDARIVFRPHPHAPILPPGIVIHQDIDVIERGVDLRDSLELADYIVTHNSTTFYDAWLQGVPTFCSEKAHYWKQAAGTIDEIPRSWGKVRLASKEKKRAWLSRVAYAQWTMAELASGEAWRFIRQHI